MTSGDGDRRTLDVRDVEGEPFGTIMSELDSLDQGETLVLVNDFEPEPLYGVLEDRGFTYDPAQEAGLWRIEVETA
ncbi:DUF2249 domain-containing protein [Halobacteriales archaeon Cl-PHB]